jgi:hypothetical protein
MNMSPEQMRAMEPRIMAECTCKKCPTFLDGLHLQGLSHLPRHGP